MQAAERLENNQLQTIKIPLSEIQWTKKGEELIIYNRLFDVKEYHQSKSNLVITGLFDEDETRLDKEVSNLWQQQKSKHDLFLLQYFHILGNACFQNNNYEINGLSTMGKSYPSVISYFPNDIYIKILFPPPQANSLTGLI